MNDTLACNAGQREVKNRKVAVLSMDVEDWYHLDYFDKPRCDRRFSLLDGLEIYAELLSSFKIPGTFFVLGELARKLTGPLQSLAAAGHDIASHGWDHVRPLTLSPGVFAEDLRRSKKEVEDVIARPVQGYRAPCFSLDRARLELVQAAGHKYDSSRIEFNAHPLYGRLDLTGFAQRSRNVFQMGEFFEFQVSTLNVGGRNLPVSGGGYLRIFPWALMKRLLKRYLSKNELYVLYIHPFELSPSPAPPLPGKTKWRTQCRFRYGRSRVPERLLRLIDLLKGQGFAFTTFSRLREASVGSEISG